MKEYKVFITGYLWSAKKINSIDNTEEMAGEGSTPLQALNDLLCKENDANLKSNRGKNNES